MSSPIDVSAPGSLIEPEGITSDKLLHKCDRNEGEDQHQDAQHGNNLDDSVVLKVDDEHGKTHDFEL